MSFRKAEITASFTEPTSDSVSIRHTSPGYPIQSDRLRRRLIDEGVPERRCCGCKLDTWLDQPIPLELDHIDGNHQNNALDNLRLLCPNCHSLTPTFRGKNKRSTSTLDSAA